MAFKNLKFSSNSAIFTPPDNRRQRGNGGYESPRYSKSIIERVLAGASVGANESITININDAAGNTYTAVTATQGASAGELTIFSNDTIVLNYNESLTVVMPAGSTNQKGSVLYR